MMSNVGCWTRRLVVLVIATSWLSACATGNSKMGGFPTCPPVSEYNREHQIRAAEELATLPKGAAIVEMLSDYAVMRDQARACK